MKYAAIFVTACVLAVSVMDIGASSAPSAAGVIVEEDFGFGRNASKLKLKGTGLVLYRMVPKTHSDSRLLELASVLGMDAVGGITEKDRIFSASDGNARIGYDELEGLTFFTRKVEHNRDTKGIAESEIWDGARRIKNALLGTESEEFDAESRSFGVLKQEQVVPQIVSKTITFYRRIGGRVVADDGAYVSVTLDGEGSPTLVECRNNDLEPVPVTQAMSVDEFLTAIRQKASKMRTLADGTKVKKVKLKRALDTYSRECRADGDYLVPSVLSIADIELEDGRIREKVITLSVDMQTKILKVKERPKHTDLIEERLNDESRPRQRR